MKITHKGKYSGASFHIDANGKIFAYSPSREVWLEDIFTQRSSLMPAEQYDKLAQTNIELG